MCSDYFSNAEEDFEHIVPNGPCCNGVPDELSFYTDENNNQVIETNLNNFKQRCCTDNQQTDEQQTGNQITDKQEMEWEETNSSKVGEINDTIMI